MIASTAELTELASQIESFDRVAIDTEADSLHCYREKLCLLQLSLPGRDYIVDPLAISDFSTLSRAIEEKEIVLHGADFDLRMLRRGLKFTARRVFDTVIAARLLGIREFSLAALVHRYFDVQLPKGSQKANWARRPLSERMLEYASNDTHYLLELAQRLEAQLSNLGRLEWFRQSCERAIEQAGIERARDIEEIWRIAGSGALRGRAAALLRELWRWRETEAEAADRPPFHILQNQELLNAAAKFDAGNFPEYRHFSVRRRGAFMAAAERALQMDEKEWPTSPRRSGLRRRSEITDRIEQLMNHRNKMATELELDPSFVAARGAVESIATDESRAETLLVPWQRKLLGIGA